MHRLVLAAAALVLTASGCAAPSADKSSAGGAAAEVRDGGKADSGSRESRSGEKGRKLTWWQRMMRSHREPEEKPWVYGDVRPGKGLLGNDEDGLVLLRKGEGRSSDPDKPAKVRR